MMPSGCPFHVFLLGGAATAWRTLRVRSNAPSGRWSGLLFRTAPLLDRGRTVALLQIRQHDRQHEFLLALIVKLDHDVLFRATQHASQPEFGMLDLSSLRERR